MSIPHDKSLFKDYLGEMRKRIKDFKYGKIKADLKGIICDYFKTSPSLLKTEGEKLNYLGVVRE
ncbi:MAG: hypothetical protein QXX42_03865 [Thermoplasmatales archaeon]